MAASIAEAAPIYLKSGTITPGEASGVRQLLGSGGSEGAEAGDGRGLYIVQCEPSVAASFRDMLTEAGAKIFAYVPENAFVVQATADVREKIASDIPHTYLAAVKPEWRMDSSVLDAANAAKSRKGATRGEGKRYTILLFEDAACDEVAKRIAKLDGCSVVSVHPPAIDVVLAEGALLEIASWVEVHWLEPYVVPEACNDVAAKLMGVPANPDAWPGGGSVLGLTGTNQVVCVCDTGLDTGDLSTINADFAGRVISTYALGRENDWSDLDGHGTHVAGSVLGSGANSGGRFKGTAPEAELVFISVGDSEGTLSGLGTAYFYTLFELAYTNQHGKAGARIFSNSWGDTIYTLTSDQEGVGCYAVNKFMFDHPDSLVVFCAGNEGVDESPADGVVDAASLRSPGTAKNCLTVGASENERIDEDKYYEMVSERLQTEPIASDLMASPPEGNPRGMAAFSSRGPCRDGRTKPDIVAPGTFIVSVQSAVSDYCGFGSCGDHYIYECGTSMSTPLVSGAAALVREWLQRDKGLENPDGATIKAVLLAGAQSLAPGQYGEGETQEIPYAYPNNVEGWGEANISNSVANSSGVLVYDAQVICWGEQQTFAFSAMPGEDVTVLMAYTDAPISMLSGNGLVNDLDLVVVTPSGEMLLPNCIESGLEEFSCDATNNVEGVRIKCAEPGIYSVFVMGRAVWIPMEPEFIGGKKNATRYSLVVNGGRESRIEEVEDGFECSPEWKAIQPPSAREGAFFTFDLSRFCDANPAAMFELVGGGGSAEIDGTMFRWTPKATGEYCFTVAASNELGVAMNRFTVKVGECVPKKFAVCVGINEYEDENVGWLAGCVNDAAYMCANLVERGGWDPADVLVLTNSLATKANIRSAITGMAAMALPDDTFIYQHSSHGGQLYPSPDGPVYGEKGLETYLAVYDMNMYSSSVYNDREIAEDLAKFPAKAKVAVIVDACNSGGLFKSRTASTASSAQPFNLAGRVSSIMAENRVRPPTRGVSEDERISPEEIGWATACEYYESSMDLGFYNTDKWLYDGTFINGYLDYGERKYIFPDYFKRGGSFLASCTWGWWSGSADKAEEADAADGWCDVHEFWQCGYNFCSKLGDFFWNFSEYNYSPQCTNITVLKSIKLGRCGAAAELPEIAEDASAEAIASQLAGCADSALVQHITDAAAYNEFKSWAQSVKESGGGEALASPYSWAAFALDAPRLIDNIETDAIEISSFGQTETGELSLEVGLKDMKVGDNARIERLVELFGLEGTSSLGVKTKPFSPNNVTLKLDECEKSDGKVRLVAAPAADSGTFFMRVKLK